MARFGTFFDGAMSWLERACLASFVAHGHDVTLFAYRDCPAPPGVRRADAAAILPPERLFRVRGGPHDGTVTQFSNLFRYIMVEVTGLIWIDTDMFCVSSAWPDRPFQFGRQDDVTVNNAVLGAPRGHPLLRDAIAVAERVGDIALWGYTGPHLLTSLVHQHGLAHEVQPRLAFYPIAHGHAAQLLTPRPGGKRLKLAPETLAIHLWHEQLRLRGLDKAAPCPAGTPLALLLATLPDGAL